MINFSTSFKSTVCDKIKQEVVSEGDAEAERQITTLSMDSFYRDLNPVWFKIVGIVLLKVFFSVRQDESQQALNGMFNFDHPDAFDHDLMLQCLTDIRNGKTTKVPVYDFKTNARVKGEFTTIEPSDVVLLEGILVFYYKEFRDLFDMKLFVDTDADTRLARRGRQIFILIMAE